MVGFDSSVHKERKDCIDQRLRSSARGKQIDSPVKVRVAMPDTSREGEEGERGNRRKEEARMDWREEEEEDSSGPAEADCGMRRLN